MNIVKSLLTTCAVVAAYVSATAAPQVTVSRPEPDTTLDSKVKFASFNLATDGNYTVAADAKATLECLETGDVLDCTEFKDFMGTILVNFNTDDIVDNGDYEFVVNAGAIMVDGVPNEKLVVNYKLADPNLEAGVEYPQISLVSSNPADGASIAELGANSINKVTFVTSDDAAVNYIGWELWNVTDENSPVWVYQSSENRIDPNRNGGKNDDRWQDGLFISIGGAGHKLIKGEKYELKLVFCGIGYNPETGQYPNDIDIEKSKELETSIFFNGLTPATEYSPYVYESVSPDPNEYVIETADQARFTITYSGPVKPEEFTYFRGTADTPVAGAFAPLGEVDADGYSSIWEFIVDPELAKTLAATALFNVSTKDKDGLYVKGNGGYQLDDFFYSVVYECLIDLPNLVSVAPEEYATVESLSEIIVSNSENLVMNYSWNALEPARICDMFGAEIRELGIPETVEGHPEQMKWTFDPITESGNYVLIIPKWYFSIGEEFEGSSNKPAEFLYTVENGSVSDQVVYDIVPASVSPADNSIVAEISEVVLTFTEPTIYPMSVGAPSATLSKVVDGVETEVAVSNMAVENDFWEPTVYTFTFAEPVKENGTYIFKVAKVAFCDFEYDESMGQSGHASDVIAYTFIVNNGTVKVEAIESAVVSDVFSVDGKIVLSNASAADVKTLPAGLYIFNGKKVIVK